jgi:outer membrane protein TolC
MSSGLSAHRRKARAVDTRFPTRKPRNQFAGMSLYLLGSLALSSGCVNQPGSRTIQMVYPLAVAKPPPRADARGAPGLSRASPEFLTDPNFEPASGLDQKPGTAPLAAASNDPGPAPPQVTAPPVSARTNDSVQGGPKFERLIPEDHVPVPAPLVIPPPLEQYPIDLSTALRLADTANPTIGAARTTILEALALQLSARSLLIPSLNYGVSYRGHTGALQRVSGKIIDVSSQSLYVGSGADVIGSGTPVIPGVNIQTALADAWFEPLAARQRLASARFSADATAYEILLDVAMLHIQLLGNQSILEAQRLSESQVDEIVTITRHFAEAGQGRDSDANRAFSQGKRRRALVLKAEEEMAVTVARLANRLNLDPSVRLEAMGGPLIPLDLVDLDTPQQELIRVALAERPDIAARNAAIREVEAHRKQEIARPLLPTLWLGFSGGVLGGGSNLAPPLVGNFGGRTDFDVRLYWTLLNLGAGNVALIRERQAQVNQAMAEQSKTINRARGEVSAALADARAAQNQITIARRELATADLGFKEDLERSRQNLGLPIEVLNSLTLLADARVDLIRALVHYDQAQFSLWVALGSPPPLEPPRTPIAP